MPPQRKHFILYKHNATPESSNWPKNLDLTLSFTLWALPVKSHSWGVGWGVEMKGNWIEHRVPSSDLRLPCKHVTELPDRKDTDLACWLTGLGHADSTKGTLSERCGVWDELCSTLTSKSLEGRTGGQIKMVLAFIRRLLCTLVSVNI